jgi:hypothetical protein
LRRSIHIAITLLAVLALIRPFDCFAGAFTRKAAACCVKGKCLPTSNADECCKGTVPAGSQLSALKAPDQSTPLPALMTAAVPISIAPPLAASAFHEPHAAPGSPPSTRLNLPLLI